MPAAIASSPRSPGDDCRTIRPGKMHPLGVLTRADRESVSGEGDDQRASAALDASLHQRSRDGQPARQPLQSDAKAPLAFRVRCALQFHAVDTKRAANPLLKRNELGWLDLLQQRVL